MRTEVSEFSDIESLYDSRSDLKHTVAECHKTVTSDTTVNQKEIARIARNKSTIDALSQIKPEDNRSSEKEMECELRSETYS